MPVPIETLQALASSFSAARDGPEQIQPGTPVIVRLTPSSANLSAVDLVPGELKLTWITKDVRFKSHTIEPAVGASPFDPLSVNALLEGGMPVRVPIVGNLVGTQELPGVPGQLAQLAGDFPVPIEMPVDLRVTWSVHAEDGTVLAPGPSTFSAPSGTTSPEVSFVFAPQVVEMTSSLSVPTVRRLIRATVTLTAGSTTHTFTLPDIPVVVPAIPIPTVIVFFLHTNFAASSGDDEGAAFIVVPNDSPLKSFSQLQSVLNTLQSTVSSLTTIAEFAAFLLGLGEFVNALSAQPHVQFRTADASNHFNNFNDVTLIQRAWYTNDTEAEDELSSLIFIGPSRKQVQCFNQRDRNPSHGQFNLTLGAKLHAIVRNLHSASPTSGPDGNEISPVVTPPGGWFAPSTFGDQLSSLKFS